MRFSGFQQILKNKGGGVKGLIHPPPIAIDFGTGSLKVLQIGPGEHPSLVAAACLPTPENLLGDHSKRITFQLEALPDLIRSCEFKGRRAVCSLPAPLTLCKHMQFQQEPGVPLMTLIKTAIPAQLKCDPSALVFRHVEVGPAAKSGKTEVICMAAPRELVERFMAAMKNAKLDPVGMHSEYTAALRAFDAITRRAEDSAITSLYLDIGVSSTRVSLAHNRDLVFARTVELGGRRLDTLVAQQLRIDIAQARDMRLRMTELARVRTPVRAAAPAAEESRLTGRLALMGGGDAAGAPPVATMEDRREGMPTPGMTPDVANAKSIGVGPPQADLSEPLEIITDEIAMSLRYHESLFPERKVDRAIFYGGEARHLGLCQHIARTLRLPAQVADPMARITRTGLEPTVGVDFSQSQPGWAVALGLCLCPTDL